MCCGLPARPERAESQRPATRSVVRGFSRYHKDTLGADLREGARRVLKLIVRANALCRLAAYAEAGGAQAASVASHK